MAEGARLESVYTFIAYRGFESLSLRQIQRTGFTPVFLCPSICTDSYIDTFYETKKKPAMQRVSVQARQLQHFLY